MMFLARFTSSILRNNHRAKTRNPPIANNATMAFMGTTERGTPYATYKNQQSPSS